VTLETCCQTIQYVIALANPKPDINELSISKSEYS
jgi:hypothetical protein